MGQLDEASGFLDDPDLAVRVIACGLRLPLSALDWCYYAPCPLRSHLVRKSGDLLYYKTAELESERIDVFVLRADWLLAFLGDHRSILIGWDHKPSLWSSFQKHREVQLAGWLILVLDGWYGIYIPLQYTYSPSKVLTCLRRCQILSFSVRLWKADLNE